MNRLSAAIVTATTLLASAAQAADLTIDVQGVAEAKGKILVAVYDKSEGWLKKAVKATRVDAVKGSTIVTISGLPEGTYAVSLYHDLDENGKLESNAIGIPTEPIGFSNDAMGAFGPASFDDAKVKLPAEGARIVVTLKSMLG